MVGSKSRLEGDAPVSAILEEDQRDRPGRRIKEDGAEGSAKRETGSKQPTEGDEGVTERRQEKPAREIATASQADREKNDALLLLGPEESTPWLPKPAKHVPRKTALFSIFGGGFYGSRSFVPEGDSDNLQDYAARSKGIQLGVSFYPMPTKKMDGIQSGVGFSFGMYRSAGSEVGADTDETVGNYAINQSGFEGAIHYRQPLGLLSVDGEVGYGHHNYVLSSDFPLEVPDTQYSAFHAGAHVDLHVTDRASIGFGGKLFYVLDNGDMSSLDWYGPGSSSGLALDASFVVPLPKQLFIRGELAYRRFSTSLDGAGIITEEEAVFTTADATMNGSVNLGIQF